LNYPNDVRATIKKLSDKCSFNFQHGACMQLSPEEVAAEQQLQDQTQSTANTHANLQQADAAAPAVSNLLGGLLTTGKLLTGLTGASLLAACGAEIGEEEDPGSGSSPSPTPSAGASPTPSPSASPTPGVTPSPTPSASPTPASSPSPSSSPSPAPAGSYSPQDDALRVLEQATFGATWADVQSVQQKGVEAWVNEQLAAPTTKSHYDWLVESGYQGDLSKKQYNPKYDIRWSLVRKFFTSPDQLRQRMAYALSQIMVVGIEGIGGEPNRFLWAANYMDILERNAFGNFRTLLNDISTSTAMAKYLTFLGSKKADGTGSQPDENYAREILQLFSIGLIKLNQDGSSQLDGSGNPVQTYTIDDIRGLSRVFTGYEMAPLNQATTGPAIAEGLRKPIVNNAQNYETGEKTFLGLTIPAGTDAASSLKLALDHIFAHQNVGPYIGRQLIQRLVTSNPSPAYVQRVAAVFANNGSGVRGDMKAVIKAVLLDTEARQKSSDRLYGKYKEPFLRYSAWARASGVQSTDGTWKSGSMSTNEAAVIQFPLTSTSVFNFYRPGYVPPNTEFSKANATVPEMQITDETTVVQFANFLLNVINSGTGTLQPSFTELLQVADDANKLVERCKFMLTANRMSTQTAETIRSAVASITGTTDDARRNRIRAALMLTMSTAEHLIQK
jgi:uncharacterized protein (DUF1800 family)